MLAFKFMIIVTITIRAESKFCCFILESTGYLSYISAKKLLNEKYGAANLILISGAGLVISYSGRVSCFSRGNHQAIDVPDFVGGENIILIPAHVRASS